MRTDPERALPLDLVHSAPDLLWEHAPQPLFALAPDGTIVRSNARFRTVFGVARSWSELVAPDDRGSATDALLGIVGVGGGASLETRTHQPAGWTLWTLRFVGELLLGTADPTTALPRVIESYRAGIHAAPHAMLLTDPGGTIAAANEHLETMLGFPSQALLGLQVEELVPMEGRAEHARARHAYARAPTRRPVGRGRDLHARCRDGSVVPVEIGLSPVQTEHGTWVLTSIVDIGPRRRREAELQEKVRELERHRRQRELLGELSSLLQHAVAEEEALDIAGSYGVKLLPDLGVLIYTLPPSRDALELVAAWGVEDPGLVRFPEADCWALRRAQLHRSTADTATRCSHGPPLGQAAQTCLPLSAHGRTLGAISIWAQPADEAIERERIQLARAVADQLALALSNIRLRERLRAQAIRDPLTGLYNRRYLEESVGRELARARRRKSAVSVLMIDVDHFKAFNDTHGHQAADEALVALARLLTGLTRSDDIACRFGGEEFVVIMPDCTIDDAVRQADRLRSACSERTEGQVTISIGVTESPSHGETWNDLYRAADVALYRAKHGGRDRVARAGDTT